MDDIDKKILQLLQTNADIPISELSKKINLSPSPCWLRISKLYKQGYIKKKIAVIDRQKVNLSTVAFVQIKTSQHNMAWAKKFVEGVKEMDEVIEFYRLSGASDYLLKVLVKDMEAFREFMVKKLTSIDHIGSTHSTFMISEVKHTTAFSLDY